ncbi:poly-gamma-glutamate system protein [Acidobacteriota bacterium]
MIKPRSDYPREGARKNNRVVLVLFLLSILFITLIKIIPDTSRSSLRMKMIKASRIMAEATETLNKCRKSKGIPTFKDDVNETGLVGVEHSIITTSVGRLEAKRTSTNPNFAALLVFLLNECGVKEGDVIAVGASGSFPALIVATLSAAKAMALNPLVISSLGASQWGANRPDFHWLEMWRCLQAQNIFSVSPLAISIGGERDVGEDMDTEGRAHVLEEIRKSRFPLLSEPDLVRNIQSRMDLYRQGANGKEIKAFVNIGGSWANMGVDSSVLRVKPGLNRITELPSLETRGMIFAMAAESIPVVHLLYVRGLAQRYGLPWDPVPLPQPGEGGALRSSQREADVICPDWCPLLDHSSAHHYLLEKTPFLLR